MVAGTLADQHALPAGLTKEEEDEGKRAKDKLHEEMGNSDDEGDTRKAATYGTKKSEVRLTLSLLVSIGSASFLPLQQLCLQELDTQAVSKGAFASQQHAWWPCTWPTSLPSLCHALGSSSRGGI